MASSSDCNTTPRRGFVPPQDEAERFLFRRVEELARLAEARGIPRATGFLSDREQVLAEAALNKAGCDCGRFDGGYPGAERKVLCLEPPDSYELYPLAALKLTALSKDLPGHRDYLGAVLGLGLERACLGDLLPDPGNPAVFYAFVLAEQADFIAAELTSAGRSPVHAEPADPAAIPPAALAEPERALMEATVASLRADAVLGAMLHTSRSLAAAAIAAGKVELNHLPLRSAHEPVFAGDLFTVRGAGRWRVKAIGGKSRKDRIFITFFQY